ncbi:hypothetical protein [Sandaracinobacteroides saxicola]|uniref:Type IV pilus biogenesis protein PilP n=1 Tax=Sandaracinobacteroides saxicola TaxID=2759707 RepID=A0A7G5IDV2_9SPHN|nr:hypothetical protein [Sandaracinobacteroides saxicola]QMW21544.1 hypothetical protein H3309_08905 [Sandaracinobacteroides saxicola]
MRFAIMTVMLLAGPLMVVQASAQTIDSAPLLACVAKVEAAERLACYDRVVAGVSAEARAAVARREAEAAKVKALAEAAAAKAAAERTAALEAEKKAAFGRETLPAAIRPDNPEGKLENLTAKLQELLVNSTTGRAVFVLDNGMMWRQTEGLEFPPVRVGSEVRLSRGMMGSYLLTIPKVGRSVKVVRLR